MTVWMAGRFDKIWKKKAERFQSKKIDFPTQVPPNVVSLSKQSSKLSTESITQGTNTVPQTMILRDVTQ